MKKPFIQFIITTRTLSDFNEADRVATSLITEHPSLIRSYKGMGIVISSDSFDDIMLVRQTYSEWQNCSRVMMEINYVSPTIETSVTVPFRTLAGEASFTMVVGISENKETNTIEGLDLFGEFAGHVEESCQLLLQWNPVDGHPITGAVIRFTDYKEAEGITVPDINGALHLAFRKALVACSPVTLAPWVEVGMISEEKDGLESESLSVPLPTVLNTNRVVTNITFTEFKPI